MADKTGRKTGGRQKGTPNKATIAREELARAQIAEALAASKKAGNADPRNAMNELYKAIQIAEGVAGKLQPASIEQNKDGKVLIVGGDLKGFGEWFDRYAGLVKELMKYQHPQMKAIEQPSKPPDPNADKPVRRFGLRVFEGGRPVQPLKTGSGEA